MNPRAWFVFVCVTGAGGPAVSGCVKTTSHVSFVDSAPVRASSASKSPPKKKTAEPRVPSIGQRIAKVAAYTLDHWPNGFRNDCSGFVEATLHRVGIPLRGSTEMFWDAADRLGWLHRERYPRPGDLAFFDYTYDRNRNGRYDDELSHLAIVLEVRRDGTIVLAHAGTRAGRSRFVMNLVSPHDRVNKTGSPINDPLRRGTNGSWRGSLAGELLRGFATIGGR